MYQAEHLDLITNVQDQFTTPLTRLSGLLETVGQQADQLDPIYIRVMVNDRQLKQLQRRLSRVQGQSVLSGIGGGGVHLGGELGGGKGHTLEDVNETLEQNFQSLEDTIDESFDRQSTVFPPRTPRGPSIGGGDGDTVARTSGGTPFESQSRILDARGIDRLEREFGAQNIPTLANTQVGAEDLLFGEGAIFGVSSSELDDLFDPEILAESFDMDAFNQAIRDQEGINLPPMSRRTLSGTPISRMMEMVGMKDTLEDRLEFQQRFTRRSTRWRKRITKSLKNMRVGMTQFYDLLAAGLPMLFTFVGSIPAFIGGVAALGTAALGAATALGSIAGLGLLGTASMQAGGGQPGFSEISDVLSDLPDEFWESFSDISQDLAPTFLDGLEGLERLFDDLARRAELLPMLEDDARAFGSFMSDFLAGTFENFIRFAEAAGPTFGMIADGLREMEVMRGLAGVLARMLPQMVALTNIIQQALPSIFSFSEGMSEVSLTTLHTLQSVIGLTTSLLELLPLVNNGNRFLGRMVGVMLTLASATLLTGRAMALYSAIAGSTVITTMTQYISSMVGGAKAMLGFSYSVSIATGALIKFIAVASLGAGLVAITGVLASEWANVGGNIDDATSSLREFQRQQQSMAGRGDAFMGNLDKRTEVYVDVRDETTINTDGNGGDIYSDAESASFIGSNFDSI